MVRRNKSGDDKWVKHKHKKMAEISPRHFLISSLFYHEQPLVDPHVSHFKHVPLRTIV